MMSPPCKATSPASHQLWYQEIVDLILRMYASSRYQSVGKFVSDAMSCFVYSCIIYYIGLADYAATISSFTSLSSTHASCRHQSRSTRRHHPRKILPVEANDLYVAVIRHKDDLIPL